MKIILAVSALAVLAAEPAMASGNTVDFYMENGVARERTLIKCAKKAPEVDKTQDCTNAKAAANRIKFSHQGSANVRLPGGKRYTGKTY